MPVGFALVLTLLTTLEPALPVAPATADRWGLLGHRVIARLAAAQISPAVRDRVSELLDGTAMADVSTWADQIRSTRTATAPWHYVNVPITDSVYRPGRVCPRQCVVSALETQLGLLADRALPPMSRSEALKWVIHLVGDLHMPLHVGDRGDRGGNDLTVTWLGRRTNLHSLWDSGLLNAMGLDEDVLVARLAARLTAADATALATGGVRAWAMESHALARDVVYAALPANLALDDRYFDAAQPVLEAQLLRGGVRLAALLERALGVR